MTNTSYIQKLADFNDFQNVCNHFGIEINNYQLNLFKRYYEVLIDWNKRINLISRRQWHVPLSSENDIILEKHFLDSIIFLPEIDDLMRRQGLQTLPPGILDIGSGAGFPAIPLSIMKPKWEFTLYESIKKKADFLSVIVKELDLKNVKIINDRVETCYGMHLHQNKYNLITARAVAKLDVLIKYAIPLLKQDGYLLAYKAQNIDDELTGAKKLIEKHNLKLEFFSKEINIVKRKLICVTVNK